MAKTRRPTRLKQLAGTIRRDRLNPREPDPLPADLTPPPELDNRAAAIFADLARDLDAAGILAQSDRLALAILARVAARLDEASEIVAAEGMIIEHRNRRYRHPAIALELECGKQLRHLLQAFGMTPASRSQVSSRLKPGAEDGDERRIFGIVR